MHRWLRVDGKARYEEKASKLRSQTYVKIQGEKI